MATRKRHSPEQVVRTTADRVVITDWKHDYNHRRRHSALGYLPLTRYAANCMHR